MGTLPHAEPPSKYHLLNQMTKYADMISRAFGTVKPIRARQIALETRLVRALERARAFRLDINRLVLMDEEVAAARRDDSWLPPQQNLSPSLPSAPILPLSRPRGRA